MKLTDFLGDTINELSFWLLRSVPETATTSLFVAETDVITNLDDKRFFWRMSVPEITLKKYSLLLNDPNASEVPKLRSTNISVHGCQSWAETMFIDENLVEDLNNDALPYYFRFKAPTYKDTGSIKELGATRHLAAIIEQQKLGPCLVMPEWYEDEAVIQVRLAKEAEAILAKCILFEQAQRLVQDFF